MSRYSMCAVCALVLVGGCEEEQQPGERCDGRTVVRCQENPVDGTVQCVRLECDVVCVEAEEQGERRAFCAAMAGLDPACAREGLPMRCVGNRPIQCRSGYRELIFDDCGAQFCVPEVGPDCALSKEQDPDCAARIQAGGECERTPGRCRFCDAGLLVTCDSGYRTDEQSCGSPALCYAFQALVPGTPTLPDATCVVSEGSDTRCQAEQPTDRSWFAVCEGDVLLQCANDRLVSETDCSPGTCVATPPGYCK